MLAQASLAHRFSIQLLSSLFHNTWFVFSDVLIYVLSNIYHYIFICMKFSRYKCFGDLFIISSALLTELYQSSELLLSASCSGISKVRITGKNQFFKKKSGTHLSSHTVSSIVFSAAYVLTIVFGMWTGVSHKRIGTGSFLVIRLSPH